MRLLTVMIVTALMTAACGGGESADETKPTAPEGTVGNVILEISEEGGFVPVEFNLTRVPRFTVFADGTMVMPPDQQFTFPGPALIPLVQSTLDDDTFSDLLTYVEDLGLADIDSVDLNNAPNVADASTTVVRYFDDAGEHRISIYALGFDSAADARSAIVASMIENLEDAATERSTSPYQPSRLSVYAGGVEGLDPQQVRNAGSWPLEVEPEEMAAEVAGFRCVTIEGVRAERLAATLADADSMTTWTSDAGDLRIIARPLLPNQGGC
jgi:hypothetical protein